MKIGRYIVGLISGLTFGMLFAPKKGQKLRAEIVKRSSSSGQDALNVLFDAFRDAGTDAVSEMKKLSENEQLQSALNMSKDRMREYLSQMEDSGYEVAARAQEKVEAMSDMAADVAAEFTQRAVRKRKAATRLVKKRVKKVTRTVKAAKTAAKTVKKAVKKPAKATAKKKTVSKVKRSAKKPAAKKPAVRKKSAAKKK